MNNLARIVKPIDPEFDFWKSNPWLTVLKPYSKLYDRDKSKNKAASNGEIMAIFLFSDPDEDVNPFFRYSSEERRQRIHEIWPEVDWEDELFKQCLSAYPQDCLSAVERAFMEEKEQLRKRSELISNTELTLDQTIIEGNKAINIKGTANQINTLQKDALKVYKQYEEIEAMFSAEKAQRAQVFGGDELTEMESDENFW